MRDSAHTMMWFVTLAFLSVSAQENKGVPLHQRGNNSLVDSVEGIRHHREGNVDAPISEAREEIPRLLQSGGGTASGKGKGKGSEGKGGEGKGKGGEGNGKGSEGKGKGSSKGKGGEGKGKGSSKGKGGAGKGGDGKGKGGSGKGGEGKGGEGKGSRN
jgi:hypothetical protein